MQCRESERTNIRVLFTKEKQCSWPKILCWSCFLTVLIRASKCKEGMGGAREHIVATFSSKKNAVLVPLRVFCLKRSLAEAFVVPWRALSWKKYDKRYLTINFTSRRYSRQSSISLLKIMKTSVNVLFKNGRDCEGRGARIYHGWDLFTKAPDGARKQDNWLNTDLNLCL